MTTALPATDRDAARAPASAVTRRSAVVQALVIAALVAVAARVAFSPEFAGKVIPSTVMGIANAGISLVAIAYLWRTNPRVLRTWFRPGFGDVALGILFAVVMFGVTDLGQHVFAPAGSPREAWIVRLYLVIGDPALLRGKLGGVFVALVAICLSEEIVWRGYVRDRLSRVYSPTTATLGAAGLYALAHTTTLWALADPVAGGNPLVVLAALFGGLIWGGMTQRAGGRLVPALIAHVAFDWAVLVMFRLWGPSV